MIELKTVKINYGSIGFKGQRKIVFCKSGRIRILYKVAEALKITPGYRNEDPRIFLHFAKDDDGHFYIYADNIEENGLKIRIVKTGRTSEYICHNKAIIEELRKELDWPLEEGKLSRVRMDVSIQPVDTKSGLQAFKIY